MNKETKNELWKDANHRWLSGRLLTMNDFRKWLEELGLFDSEDHRNRFLHFSDEYDTRNPSLCGHVLTYYLRRFLKINE